MQWPRMSTWGFSTAATMRLVIAGRSMRRMEWALATTTSRRPSSASLLVEGAVVEDVDFDAA